LPTIHRLYQAAEQSKVGAVWKVIEVDSEPDDEDLGVIKAEDDSVEDGLVEDDLVGDDSAEDPRFEAVHRLPYLSPLSNVHADLSPRKLKNLTTLDFSTLTHAADELFLGVQGDSRSWSTYSLPTERTHFPGLWINDLLYEHPSNLHSPRTSYSPCRLSTITFKKPVTFLDDGSISPGNACPGPGTSLAPGDFSAVSGSIKSASRSHAAPGKPIGASRV
jgi:hypothetical protein